MWQQQQQLYEAKKQAIDRYSDPVVNNGVFLRLEKNCSTRASAATWESLSLYEGPGLELRTSSSSIFEGLPSALVKARLGNLSSFLFFFGFLQPNLKTVSLLTWGKITWQSCFLLMKRMGNINYWFT